MLEVEREGEKVGKIGKKQGGNTDKGWKGWAQNQPLFGDSKFKIGAAVCGSRIVFWGV